MHPTKSDVTVQSQSGLLATHKVLRSTYLLLSVTLFFSAATAGLAMVMQVPPMKWYVMLIGYFGLMFLTTRAQ